MKKIFFFSKRLRPLHKNFNFKVPEGSLIGFDLLRYKPKNPYKCDFRYLSFSFIKVLQGL